MQKKQKTQKKVAMPDSQPPLTRDRILDAAQTILLRDGGDRLTIASVAKEARISKGGLFYHFASKQELVEGLIERYTREFDLLLESAGDSPGSAIDTYIRSAGRSDGPASRGVIAMLAAVIVDSEALGLLRQKYDHWNERLHADGIHGALRRRWALARRYPAARRSQPELSRQDDRIPPADGGALQSGTEHMNA